MKKLFTLFAAALFMQYSNAQTPLTLTQSNFGKIGTYNVSTTTKLSTVTFAGTNYTLNYDTAVLTPNGTLSYPTATDAYFSSSCDAYSSGMLNAKNFGYSVDYYYSTNASSYSENGLHVLAQGYSEASVTGGANDSIIFAEQKMLFTQPRTILKFPATMGYKNSSVCRRAINFTITVAAAGLNHAPAQHVSTVYRQDTITGWGQMRIYTTTGKSIYYPVLSMLSKQYNIDSFYLNGSPAPTSLLNAFGEKQGEHTNDNNRIYYFRANRAQPLLLVNLDSAMTSFTNLTFDGDNITKATGVNELEAGSWSTILFPNPSKGSFNIRFIGKHPETINYTICDFSGRLIQSGSQLKLNNNELALEMRSALPNGNYFLKITDQNNSVIATETLSLLR